MIKMKIILGKYFWLVLVLQYTTIYAQKTEKPIEETVHFKFYNNYWVNLHHFLYEHASASQKEKLKEDDLYLLDIGEKEVLKQLRPEEVEALNKASAYYKKNLISKSLLFDLAKHRLWLQERADGEIIVDTSFSKEFTNVLNQVSPVYRKRLWKMHKKHNSKIIKQHLSLVKGLERPILKRLEELTGYSLPKHKIRVDLTAYGGRFGAYSQAFPTPNVTISTLDALAEQSAFVEMVFHETSHFLFVDPSALIKRLNALSKELNVKPRDLWHAIQFYVSGRLVQKALKEIGVEHELVMKTKAIFSRFNNEPFRAALDLYMTDSISQDEALRKLLMNLKK